MIVKLLMMRKRIKKIEEREGLIEKYQILVNGLRPTKDSFMGNLLMEKSREEALKYARNNGNMLETMTKGSSMDMVLTLRIWNTIQECGKTGNTMDLEL